jgi:Mn-containing catalase
MSNVPPAPGGAATTGAVPIAAAVGEPMRRLTVAVATDPPDYKEIVAVFTGPHPETGEELQVVDEAPEGFPMHDLPSQPAVFAPDYAPEEIKEIAQSLRKRAGLPDEPLGEVAGSGNGGGIAGKVMDKLT